MATTSGKIMETECTKCKVWQMAAIQCGYSTGMCEKCFNDNFVSIPNQHKRSQSHDFYQKLAKEYLDGKEYWETDPSEKISIECFANWLDRRCIENRPSRIVLDHDILEDLDPMIKSGEVERLPGGFIRRREDNLTYRAPDLGNMSDSMKKKYAKAKKICEDSWIP